MEPVHCSGHRAEDIVGDSRGGVGSVDRYLGPPIKDEGDPGNIEVDGLLNLMLIEDISRTFYK